MRKKAEKYGSLCKTTHVRPNPTTTMVSYNSTMVTKAEQHHSHLLETMAVGNSL